MNRSFIFTWITNYSHYYKHIHLGISEPGFGTYSSLLFTMICFLSEVYISKPEADYTFAHDKVHNVMGLFGLSIRVQGRNLGENV